MNKYRRSLLGDIIRDCNHLIQSLNAVSERSEKIHDELIEKLERINADIYDVQGDEQYAYDNLPEGFQNCDRGYSMDDAISYMDDAQSIIDDALEIIRESKEAGSAFNKETVIKKLESAASCLDDARSC